MRTIAKPMTLAAVGLLAAAAAWPLSAQPGPDKGTAPAVRPDVAVVGEGGATAPRRFALVVGIDKYGDYSSLGNLRGCVADAEAISKVLVERCGYTADHVVALTDTQFRVPIQQRIKSLFQGLKPEDVVLFYFSGHGMRGPDGQDYLVPLDGDPDDPSHTMLSTQEVRELLRKSGAGQILMVMDCCRNTADGRAASTGGFGERSVAAEKDARDLVVFQSCGPDEVSHELPDSNRGAYSSYLEEGLSGQADANGDGLVTVAELQTYVRDHVSDWARQHKTVQVPAISLADVGDPIRTAGIVVARVASRGPGPQLRETGSLVISVAPVEAEVQVGNQPAQRTQGGSLTLQGLPPGDLNVVVRAQGYQQETRAVRIEGGQAARLEITLRPVAAPPSTGAQQWFDRGEQAHKAERWQEAIGYFTKAIEIDAKFARAYEIRGCDESRLGEYGKAISDLDTAIALEPKWAVWLYDRAIIEERHGDTAATIRDCTTAIGLDPKDNRWWAERSRAYTLKGDYARALEDGMHAVALAEQDSDKAICYHQCGVVHCFAKRFQEALKAVDEAISLQPENAFYYGERAKVWHSLGRDDKALEDVEHCRKLGGTPDVDLLRQLPDEEADLKGRAWKSLGTSDFALQTPEDWHGYQVEGFPSFFIDGHDAKRRPVRVSVYVKRGPAAERTIRDLAGNDTGSTYQREPTDVCLDGQPAGCYVKREPVHFTQDFKHTEVRYVGVRGQALADIFFDVPEGTLQENLPLVKRVLGTFRFRG